MSHEQCPPDHPNALVVCETLRGEPIRLDRLTWWDRLSRRKPGRSEIDDAWHVIHACIDKATGEGRYIGTEEIADRLLRVEPIRGLRHVAEGEIIVGDTPEREDMTDYVVRPYIGLEWPRRFERNPTTYMHHARVDER